jgi:uncharacterized membrane protein YqhA
MKTLIEKTRYINLVAVLALLLASIAALGWGAVKTYKAIALIINSAGSSPEISAYLIQLVDAFLVSLVLYIFAVSIYHLTVEHLDLPPWMLADNLHELKSKLSSVIILVAGVYFVERVLEGLGGLDVLYLAGAIALVSGALIAFSVLGEKD